MSECFFILAFCLETVFFQILEAWFLVFVDPKPTPENPIFIYADAHKSRLSFTGLMMLKNNSIHLWVGVVNGTHLYQTLDNLIFKEYNNIRKKKKITKAENEPNASHTWYDEVDICLNALKETMIEHPEYTISSIKNVGLVPWDEDKLTNHEHLTLNVVKDIDVSKLVNGKEPDDKPKKKNVYSKLQFGGLLTSDSFINDLPNDEDDVDVGGEKNF